MSGPGRRCVKCGAPLREGANFCTSCATPVEGEKHSPETAAAPAAKQPKGRTAAFLVAAGLVILIAAIFLARSPDDVPEGSPPSEESTAAGGAERFGGGVEALLREAPPAEREETVSAAEPVPPPEELPVKPAPPPKKAPAPAKKTAETPPPAAKKPISAGVKFARFTHEKLGFATVLPSHWESEAKGGGGWSAIVFSGPKGTDEYLATVNIQIVTRTEGSSLQAQENFLLNDLEMYSGFRVMSRSQEKVSGLPAVTVLVTYQPPGEESLYRQEQVIVAGEKYYYWIGYTVPERLFDRYRFAIAKAVDEFRILP